MLRAIDAGLTLRDFDILTAGMILDFIITASNDRSEDDGVREATQEDYDRF
jgi:hypothetical protein